MLKQAMILAAGKGERMRPLTDNLPKPLLPAGGKPLLQYHLENLARAGVARIVINHARHGELIESRFGTGSAFGVDIVYSPEGEIPLETGGGIKRALPLLAPGPFMVINADIWTNYDFRGLPAIPSGLAHLVLVNNPGHHAQGDFCLHDGKLTQQSGEHYTYSGIGVFKPELIAACPDDIFPLGPVLHAAVSRGEISGELHTGYWLDVGTPERLSKLEQHLRASR